MSGVHTDCYYKNYIENEQGVPKWDKSLDVYKEKLILTDDLITKHISVCKERDSLRQFVKKFKEIIGQYDSKMMRNLAHITHADEELKKVKDERDVAMTGLQHETEQNAANLKLIEQLTSHVKQLQDKLQDLKNKESSGKEARLKKKQLRLEKNILLLGDYILREGKLSSLHKRKLSSWRSALGRFMNGEECVSEDEGIFSPDIASNCSSRDTGLGSMSDDDHNSVASVSLDNKDQSDVMCKPITNDSSAKQHERNKTKMSLTLHSNNEMTITSEVDEHLSPKETSVDEDEIKMTKPEVIPVTMQRSIFEPVNTLDSDGNEAADKLVDFVSIVDEFDPLKTESEPIAPDSELENILIETSVPRIVSPLSPLVRQSRLFCSDNESMEMCDASTSMSFAVVDVAVGTNEHLEMVTHVAVQTTGCGSNNVATQTSSEIPHNVSCKVIATQTANEVPPNATYRVIATQTANEVPPNATYRVIATQTMNEVPPNASDRVVATQISIEVPPNVSQRVTTTQTSSLVRQNAISKVTATHNAFSMVTEGEVGKKTDVQASETEGDRLSEGIRRVESALLTSKQNLLHSSSQTRQSGMVRYDYDKPDKSLRYEVDKLKSLLLWLYSNKSSTSSEHECEDHGGGDVPVASVEETQLNTDEASSQHKCTSIVSEFKWKKYACTKLKQNKGPFYYDRHRRSPRIIQNKDIDFTKEDCFSVSPAKYQVKRGADEDQKSVLQQILQLLQEQRQQSQMIVCCCQRTLSDNPKAKCENYVTNKGSQTHEVGLRKEELKDEDNEDMCKEEDLKDEEKHSPNEPKEACKEDCVRDVSQIVKMKWERSLEKYKEAVKGAGVRTSKPPSLEELFGKTSDLSSDDEDKDDVHTSDQKNIKTIRKRTVSNVDDMPKSKKVKLELMEHGSKSAPHQQSPAPETNGGLESLHHTKQNKMETKPKLGKKLSKLEKLKRSIIKAKLPSKIGIGLAAEMPSRKKAMSSNTLKTTINATEKLKSVGSGASFNCHSTPTQPSPAVDEMKILSSDSCMSTERSVTAQSDCIKPSGPSSDGVATETSGLRFIEDSQTSTPELGQTEEKSLSSPIKARDTDVLPTRVTRSSTPPDRHEVAEDRRLFAGCLLRWAFAEYQEEYRKTHIKKPKSVEGQLNAMERKKEQQRRVQEKKLVTAELHKVVKNSELFHQVLHKLGELDSETSTLVLAKRVVKYIRNDTRDNLDYSKDPRLFPPLTRTQQVLITLIFTLQSQHQWYKNLAQTVLSGIEYQLFRLGYAPDVARLCSLARFYAAICRRLGDKQRVRAFCYDAMYCLCFKAYPLLFTVFITFADALPHASTGKNMLLVMCMTSLILTQSSDNQHPDYKIDALKTMLCMQYGYNKRQYTVDQLIDLLANQLRSGTGHVEGLEASFILLAKRMDWEMSYRRVVSRVLVPLLEEWKKGAVGDHVAKPAINIMGYITRCYPLVQSQACVQTVLNHLDNVLLNQKNVSPEMQEAIVSSMLCLSRHNFYMVTVTLAKWQPHSRVSAELMQKTMTHLQCRNPKWWLALFKKKEIPIT